MLTEITITLNKWMRCKYCMLSVNTIVIEKHGFSKNIFMLNIKVGLGYIKKTTTMCCGSWGK
jgi:hypothetical protein